MKRYEATSCHSIGYSWEIDAPDDMTQEQVEALCKALIDFTDTPCQKDLDAFITGNYHVDADGLEGISMETLRKVDIYTEAVHRESFVNDSPREV